MRTKKKYCAHPGCRNSFMPHKRNPAQKYCKDAECVKSRANARQKKSYRKNIRIPDWKKKHMNRKKRERADRMKRNSESEAVEVPSVPEIYSLLMGLTYYMTGAGSREEVDGITEKCRSLGKNLLYVNKFRGKISGRFPHSGFEAET